jgi:hypothetical protein
MSGGIYLLQEGGGLVEMGETAYDSESLLQSLLATYPSLLAGDQVNPSAPRRWLLISREVGLASEEGGSARWAVDHVFVDQDAIPTLVEVKRSTDTRIRREVVGQMLDYAANAVVYWPVESMRAQFERACSGLGREPADVLAEFLGDDADPDAFWQQAKTNLQAGRIRMVFVADVIPPELQRIVEFLNGQMNFAEVLAVEVRQYVGQGQRAMVPRVLGQTASAQQKKATAASTPSPQWEAERFFEVMGNKHDASIVNAVRAIRSWAERSGLRLVWGKGKVNGTLYPKVSHHGNEHYTISVSTDGYLYVEFGNMRKRAPFAEDAKRKELLDRLNRAEGVTISADRIDGWPSVPLRVLSDGHALHTFLEGLDWYVEQVRAS